MTYIIERGIPLPPPTHKRAGREPGELQQTLACMHVGESFAVGTNRERKDAIKRFPLLAPRKFSCRREVEGGKGWRVWGEE